MGPNPTSSASDTNSNSLFNLLDFHPLQACPTSSCQRMEIILPHPAAYALHKFIIFKRRKKIDKHDRDIEGALRVFKELMHHNQKNEIKRVFNTMHTKWQKEIVGNLKSINETEVLDTLIKR